MDLKASYRRLRSGVKMELALLNSKLSRLPPGVPHSLFLCLTYRCQLRCAHCRYLQPAYKTARRKDMPLKLALRILAGAAAAGIPRVIMFGGEPALYADLEKVIKEASALGLFAEMDTNGLKLTREKLSSLAAAGLCAFRISLHSSSAGEHNSRQNSKSFTRIKATVNQAVKEGFLVYLSSCLSGGNNSGENISGLAALGKKWGVHGIRFLHHVSDELSSRKTAAAIAVRIRKKGLNDYARTCFETAGAAGCAAQQGKTVFISPEGIVRACPYAVKILGHGGKVPGFHGQAAPRNAQMLPCSR
ncbi:MAG: hypothetical protein A2285_03195 [Elusimicrobia bacterium RIFOXYA12_FULL_57_11]|nr:MAG: hypothetical protein A2285_03195 [Elusimicrobia bacterium RIFOXYA12_FULL_57_11]